MKRRLYAPVVLLIGLLSAEIVATAHVYLSDLNLLQATDAIIRSGYLAVPNSVVAEGLTSLTTAMAGGLFFTLSIGAGLALITLMVVWWWDRALRRRRRASVLCMLAWIAALVAINIGGINLVASLYLLIVPAVTATAAIVLLPKPTTLLSPRNVIWPVAAAVILGLLWSLVADANLFTNIRDYLLLASPIGRSITEAYYDYTLYPAEAFKPLAQKQLRTCVLAPSLARGDRHRIERIVRSRDYLPVPNGFPADLTISSDGAPRGLSLDSGGSRVLAVTDTTFFDAPDDVLATFSSRTDRNRMFRMLAMACLLLGLPLVLFTFLFSLLSLIPDLLITMAVSDMVTAALCLVVGISLLVPVYTGRKALAVPADPAGSLASPSVHTRIAALRQAVDAGRDVSGTILALDLTTQASIAERYWLARSLANAHRPEADRLLENLADDPVTLISCQALWAIGESERRDMIPWIIERIKTSSHWYFQMYAYRTLRTLGWVQPQSTHYSR